MIVEKKECKNYTTNDVKAVAYLLFANPAISSKELQELCFSNGVLHGDECRKQQNWQFLKAACQKVLGPNSIQVNGTRFATVKLNLTLEEVDQKIQEFGGRDVKISLGNPWKKEKKSHKTEEKKQITTISPVTVPEQTREEKTYDAKIGLKTIRAIINFLDDPDRGSRSKAEVKELCEQIEQLQRRSLRNLVIETYIEAKKREVEELRSQFL